MSQAAVSVGARLTCPHCLVAVVAAAAKNPHNIYSTTFYGSDGELCVSSAECPACHQLLVQGTFRRSGLDARRFWIWPRSSGRNPIPASVPPAIADNYREAAEVLSISPKASAALSRRCLQAVLHDRGFHEKNLVDQIASASKQLTPHLADDLNYVRHIGNFSAHPTKSAAGSMIVDVVDGEAEWSLDVLDLLFQHYYAAPEDSKSRRKALDAKLQAAGKKLPTT